MVTVIVGNIGSGKSTVLAILKSLGKTVIDCDEINRELLSTPEYLKNLQENFPNTFVDGKLDKSLLSRLIFSDGKSRTRLNEIAHPKIEAVLLKKLSKIKGDVFVEVPLLNALKNQSFYDEIWLVECSPEIQLKYLSSRDNISIEQATRKIQAQKQTYNYGVPIKIIRNDKEKAALQRLITELLAERV